MNQHLGRGTLLVAYFILSGRSGDRFVSALFDGDQCPEKKHGDCGQTAGPTQHSTMDEFRPGLDRCPTRSLPLEQHGNYRVCGCPDLFNLFTGGMRIGAPVQCRITLGQRLFPRDYYPADPALSVPSLFRICSSGFDRQRVRAVLHLHGSLQPLRHLSLRTYFLAIPKELEEAPVIGGASRWQVFSKVLLPLVSPGVLTVALISGLNIWNEFLISSTFLQSHDQQTAVVRFYTLGGQYTSDWGEIMAAAILIVAPAVGFFLLMQRRFIQGMAAGSVKG